MRIIHCSLSTSTLAGRRFITKDYLPTTHFQWNFNRLARRLKIEKWLNRVPVHTQFITSYSSHRKKRNSVSIQQTQTVRTSLRFTNNSFPPPSSSLSFTLSRRIGGNVIKAYLHSSVYVLKKGEPIHHRVDYNQQRMKEMKKKNRNKYKIRARPHTLSIGPISRRKLHRENDSIFSSGSHTHKRRIPTNQQQKKRGKTYCTFFSVFLLLDRLKLSNSVSYGESKRVDMDNGGSTVRP
jgi:hypothetical protein